MKNERKNKTVFVNKIFTSFYEKKQFEFELKFPANKKCYIINEKKKNTFMKNIKPEQCLKDLHSTHGLLKWIRRLIVAKFCVENL